MHSPGPAYTEPMRRPGGQEGAHTPDWQTAALRNLELSGKTGPFFSFVFFVDCGRWRAGLVGTKYGNIRPCGPLDWGSVSPLCEKPCLRRKENFNRHGGRLLINYEALEKKHLGYVW